MNTLELAETIFASRPHNTDGEDIHYPTGETIRENRDTLQANMYTVSSTDKDNTSNQPSQLPAASTAETSK